MRALPVLLSLLVASALAAGCLGGADDAGDAEPSSTPADNSTAMTNETLQEITDDGTKSENETLGHMPHLHDYWDGKERVTLMDEDITVDPFTAMFFTFMETVGRQSPSVGGAFFGLPDGMTVFEGTGQLEVTATWQEPTITAMTVRYRSAAGPQFSEPNPLATGAPLVIPVTPEMTDMPHVSSSRWAFFVEPAGAGNVVYGTFHVKVDIVKMRDIGLFPGHPELFEGAHEKILVDADGQSAQQSGINRFVTAVSGGGPDSQAGVQSAEVVPMETLEMRVDLTVTSVSTSTGGSATDIWLIYKSADTNRWRVAEQIEGDLATGKFVFAIPVEHSMVDSPYAKESNWWFDVRASSEVVAGTDTSCGGCADTQVDYHITVTAFDSNVLLAPGSAEDDDGGERARSAAPALPLALKEA